MFVSFGIGIIGMGFIFIWRYGNPKNSTTQLKIGASLVGQMVLTWIIAFGSLSIIEFRARQELVRILSDEEVTLRSDLKTRSSPITVSIAAIEHQLFLSP